jgi:predicted ATPase/DNA-binding SARP family transcriptional activator/DNA-binding NarL/FixJ family response regulator
MSRQVRGSVSRRPEVVRVHLLGGFRVLVGPRVIEENAWRRRKAATLVKLLALAPGHRLHREQVMDTLWSNLGARAASNNLRQALHAARRALDPDPDIAPHYLSLQNEQLALCPGEQCWVDVEALQEAAIAARRSREPAAYRAAIELYAGDLLPEDRYEEWAESRRTELQRLYLTLLVEMAGLHEQRGDFGRAIEALQRVVGIEPTHEEAYEELMRLYTLEGRRGEALAQYERLVEVLSKELGVEPAASSRALREQIEAGRFPAEGEERSLAGEPVKTPGPSRHNLPAARSSFVGREREMLEIKRQLSMTRLLTLVGAGGSGKTRLALEVARDLVEACPDGVWIAELSGLSDGTLVPQAVAGALGIREQPGQPLVDTLVDALRVKNMLLILDNCEHLVEAAARLVDMLLDSCPRLRVLATSREPLGVEGEVRWPVLSLSVPDTPRSSTRGELERSEAARLFVERAADRYSGFTLGPENTGAVAEICQRLEGIPLAIELAAARVGLLSVGQISERLEDSLGLLTGGGRTRTPRQRTLHGALDWSHDLLSEQERVLFRRLSVFAGGWTLKAAEAVGTGESVRRGEVLELLSGLVEKSLVVAETPEEGEVRYRLLEPIRHYARQKLEESEEAEVVRRQHTEFFLALAEEAEPKLRGPEQGRWLDRLEPEHDNLRAALDWSAERRAESGLRLCAALWQFWYVRGYLSEGRRQLEEGIARYPAAPAKVRAKAFDGAGWLAQAQGDYESARALYEEQLDLSHALEDEEGIARSFGNLGSVALSQGEHERATELLGKSLALHRKLGSREETITVLLDLGASASSQGRLAQAIVWFQEALALCRKFGDKFGAAASLGNLGKATLLQGDHERATALLAESLALFRELGDRLDIAVALMHLGFAALTKGDYERAAELLEEGLQLSRELGDNLSIAKSLEGIAGVAAVRGQAHRAARLWGAAQAMREYIGAPVLSDELTLHEPYMDAVRTQVAREVWETAQEEGERMTLEEAGEYALSENDAISSITVSPESPEDKALHTLTRREEEVAVLVARGLTNRDIAKGLHLSEHTVATHVRKIFKKLGLRSRAQLGSWLSDQQGSSLT